MTKARTLADNFAADINGITAGTGITGGGTSGTVTITNEMATTITAKGDLLAGTGNAAFDNLAAGNNGETLVADSSASTGLRWQGNYAAGKNYVINGNMNIAQRGTSTSGVTSSGYPVDRLLLQMTTMGTVTLSQETDAPSGFGNSAKVLVTTADAAPAAGDRVRILYRNEGQMMQGLQYGSANAKTVTVSFWVKSNVTGTYILEMVTSDGSTNRDICATYTVSASGTWEKKTLTFVGDTAQVITNSNLQGWELSFWLGAGSDFTSGALQTTWGTLTNANRAVGQTNVIAATNNYWQITGLQAEIGNVATDFQLSSGTLAGELAACQRYYFRVTGSGSGDWFASGLADSTTSALFTYPFKVEMRIAPTALEQSGTAGDYSVRRQGNNSVTCSAVPSFGAGARNQGLVVLTVASGLTAGEAIAARAVNTSAYLGWSAEL